MEHLTVALACAPEAGRRVAPIASTCDAGTEGEGRRRDIMGASCSKPETRQLCFAATSEGVQPLFALEFECVGFCLRFAALAGRRGLSEVLLKIQKN